MSERNLGDLIRNTIAATAIIPAAHFAVDHGPTFSPEIDTNRTQNTLFLTNSQHAQAQEDGIIENFDGFFKTKEGKIIADALFALALFQAASTLQRSRELDKNRKIVEAAAASCLFVAITASFSAQQFTDVNDQLKASLIFGWSLFQNAYMLESSLEREKEIIKRGSVLATAASLQVIATIVLVNAFR